MKFFLVALCVVGLLFTNVFQTAAAAPNFSGTWVLDKTKSKDLPQQWQSIESLTMAVTQDDKSLNVDTQVKRSESGGEQQPGNRGGRGMGMMNGTAAYKLDGSETKVEATGERAMNSTLKAVLGKDGKTLELTTIRKGNFQGNEVTLTTTENWELSADGKILTVKRTSESPRGSQSSTLIFNKQ